MSAGEGGVVSGLSRAQLAHVIATLQILAEQAAGLAGELLPLLDEPADPVASTGVITEDEHGDGDGGERRGHRQHQLGVDHMVGLTRPPE